MITISTNKIKKTIYASELSVGDTAIIETDSLYAGHLVLRNFLGLVSLTDPNQTWTFSNNANAPFFKVRKVNVEMIIKD